MACVLPCSYVHTGPKAPATHQVGSDLDSAVEWRAQVSCQASRPIQIPSIATIGVCGRARLTPVRKGSCRGVEPIATVGATMQHRQKIQHCVGKRGGQGIRQRRNEGTIRRLTEGRRLANLEPGCAWAGLML